jgi:putative transposase
MLINTPRGNLSRCMRHIDGVYTQRFNRIHSFDSPLFRGRFKSILVDGDSYLLQLVRYIHKNPVRAGVAEVLEQHPWSSHKGYLSASKKWDWLHKEFILSLLSQEKQTQLSAYRKLMKTEDSEEIAKLFERKKWPAFLVLGMRNLRSGCEESFLSTSVMRKSLNPGN